MLRTLCQWQLTVCVLSAYVYRLVLEYVRLSSDDRENKNFVL